MEKYNEVSNHYFKIYAVAKDFTAATIRTKKYGLQNFAIFCRENSIDVLTSDVMLKYMSEMKNRGCSRNYVQKRIYSDIKPFLNYASRHGVEDEINWDDDFPRKKRVEIKRTAYSEEEIYRIFAACRNSHDTLMCALAYECGFRRIEMTRCLRENFDARRGTIFLKRKGDKNQLINLPKNIVKMMMAEFRKICSRYLFPAGYSKRTGDAPVSVDTLHSRAKRIGRRAGLPNFHLHELRYSFATEMFDFCGNIRSVSEKLGHSDIRTTEFYIQKHSLQAETDYLGAFSGIDERIFAKFGGKFKW